MTFKGYVFHRKDGTSGIVLPGRLDEEIAARLHNRPDSRLVRLEHVKNGNVLDHGPWRVPSKCSNGFANTIGNEGKIGWTYRISGRFRELFHIDVVSVPKGELVLQAGLTEIGVPYVFGQANGPEDPGKDEFDCSGFTEWAWSTVGVSLPHNAEAQRTASNVREFSSATMALHGDLVFMWFPNSRGIPSNHASHVGLFYSFGSPIKVLDTRNPVNEPVAIRDGAGIIGYGRPS